MNLSMGLLGFTIFTATGMRLVVILPLDFHTWKHCVIYHIMTSPGTTECPPKVILKINNFSCEVGDGFLEIVEIPEVKRFLNGRSVQSNSRKKIYEPGVLRKVCTY